MSRYFYILFTALIISSFIFACGTKENNKSNSVSTLDKQTDTFYVEIDSSKKINNIMIYNIVYERPEQKKIVFSEKSQDYSLDVIYNYSYHKQNKDYISFLIYYCSTGQKKNLLVDKKSKRIYMTDYYDSRAVGDSIIRESVDFKNKETVIRDLNSLTMKDYIISIQEIGIVE